MENNSMIKYLPSKATDIYLSDFNEKYYNGRGASFRMRHTLKMTVEFEYEGTKKTVDFEIRRDYEKLTGKQRECWGIVIEVAKNIFKDVTFMVEYDASCDNPRELVGTPDYRMRFETLYKTVKYVVEVNGFTEKALKDGASEKVIQYCINEIRKGAGN